MDSKLKNKANPLKAAAKAAVVDAAADAVNVPRPLQLLRPGGLMANRGSVRFPVKNRAAGAAAP